MKGEKTDREEKSEESKTPHVRRMMVGGERPQQKELDRGDPTIRVMASKESKAWSYRAEEVAGAQSHPSPHGCSFSVCGVTQFCVPARFP